VIPRKIAIEGPDVSVSVVIPTRDRGDLIAQTLGTLLSLRSANFEIIVVDQSTDDRTRAAVARVADADPRVRYVATKTVGCSAARNIGYQISSADVVAYCDDDCIVTPEWFEALLETFRVPRVAALYGRLVPYERGRRTGVEVGFKPSPERREYQDKTPPWHIGHGGNMAFRRWELAEAGGFDPLLGAGGILRSAEDIDIAYRLIARGRTVVYDGASIAYHKHWKDWPAQKQMERAYGVGAGAQFAKYMRCGDAYAARLLLAWVWQLGVRRMGAGLLKWRSRKVMYLAYCQLVYPWAGIWMSLRHGVDRRRMVYAAAGASSGNAAE